MRTERTRVRRPAAAWLATALIVAAAGCSTDATETAPVNEYGNPLKWEPRPTSAEIGIEDLKTRIYAFADDSMLGRRTGTEGHRKATAFIAAELERLGIEPGGDDGTYFQGLPYVVRKYTSGLTLSVDGTPLAWEDEFVAVPGDMAPREIENAQVIFGGVQNDTANTITAAQANGKLVVLEPAPPGQRGRGGRGRGRGGRGGRGASNPLAGAAAIAVVDLQNLDAAERAEINDANGQMPRDTRDGAAPPARLRITPEAAAKLFGGQSLDQLEPGALGGTVTAALDWVEDPVPELARNVVGIVRGSDPALAGQFVAVGAHSDHVGIAGRAIDHDSARAYSMARLALQMASGDLRRLSDEEEATISVNLDSIRALRPVRMDSINNGADDDGSGSMAVLEIAEAIALADAKPRRSIVFVWHAGEELGLDGSEYFTDNPTVPRDSIVAQINLDMIGRGRAEDIIGGGDDYLAVVGSSRLSTELGAMVTAVNERQPAPFRLDYRFDEETSWPGYNNIYGRSDHWNYARFGIPIAFFFTGLHADYHRPTDEPQYIDFPHYTRVVEYIHDLVVEVANRDQRPVVDVPQESSGGS